MAAVKFKEYSLWCVYVFWNKLIEKENLLSKGCSGADFLQAIHILAERYGITDEMTKNFLVYNFQKEKTQNGKKR